MNITLYPTFSEVLELHKILVNKFGGSGGVRDLGLLESALMRPQTGYYDSLSLQAAALLQSLCQNHAFLDGNKRVAFATTAIFLRMNNYTLNITADEGERFLIQEVIQRGSSLESISKWLEKYMEKI